MSMCVYILSNLIVNFLPYKIIYTRSINLKWYKYSNIKVKDNLAT